MPYIFKVRPVSVTQTHFLKSSNMKLVAVAQDSNSYTEYENILKAMAACRYQCTFCLAEPEKVEHLFWHCNVVNHFWQNIEQWIYTKADFLINIHKVRAIFGIAQENLSMKPVNCILIASRYYIYKCRMTNSNLSLIAWENHVKQFLKEEKTITIKNDRYEKLKKHWDKWLNAFNIYLPDVLEMISR